MQPEAILRRGVLLGIVFFIGLKWTGEGLHWFISGASYAYGPGRRLAVLVQIALGVLLTLGTLWWYRQEERRLRQASA
ncbi:MAG TPA: hypothetical protein VF192_13710 [Longimicrobiales bacterium]